MRTGNIARIISLTPPFVRLIPLAQRVNNEFNNVNTGNAYFVPSYTSDIGVPGSSNFGVNITNRGAEDAIHKLSGAIM